MVIIAMMSALVIPKLTGSLGNMNLKTSARKITSTLRVARNLAVSESKTMAVVFDLDARQVSLEYGGTRYGNQTGVSADKEGDSADKETDKKSDTRSLNQFRYTLPEEVSFGKAMLGEKEHLTGRFKIFFYPVGGASGGTFFYEALRKNFFRLT